jgi:hypothetical protein
LTAAGIRPKLCTVLADSGYVTEENFARAEWQKLRLLAPLGKDPATRYVPVEAWRAIASRPAA